MNAIHIWEPRWHDRAVLVADHRLQEHNQVVIEHKEFPTPFYVNGRWARQWPLEQMSTKSGGVIAVRAIPLVELCKETISI